MEILGVSSTEEAEKSSVIPCLARGIDKISGYVKWGRFVAILDCLLRHRKKQG